MTFQQNVAQAVVVSIVLSVVGLGLGFFVVAIDRWHSYPASCTAMKECIDNNKDLPSICERLVHKCAEGL